MGGSACYGSFLVHFVFMYKPLNDVCCWYKLAVALFNIPLNVTLFSLTVYSLCVCGLMERLVFKGCSLSHSAYHICLLITAFLSEYLLFVLPLSSQLFVLILPFSTAVIRPTFCCFLSFHTFL